MILLKVNHIYIYIYIYKKKKVSGARADTRDKI